MKTYKLIKEYPGSPELGTIVNRKCTTDIWKGTTYYETYPEFWQEVIEKDYEILISRVVPQKILSVKRLSDGEVFTVGDKIKTPYTDCTQITGFTNPEGNEYFIEIPTGLTRLLNLEKVIEKDYEIISAITKYDPKNDYKAAGSRITSVKRLSDGKIFSIGDALSNICGSKQLIKEFYLNKEGIMCVYTDRTCRFSLDYIDVKYPIFLTHDGKDIFDGDKVWYVNKQDHYKSYFIASKNQSFFSDRMAYFLTRQDAEDYIEKNKVLFTTEDGVGIKHGDTYYFVDTDFSIHTMKAHPGAGQYSERKYFSTVEEAHEYVMQNVKALSIKDFWEITCMSTSNFNKSAYMRDLVKKTLGIK